MKATAERPTIRVASRSRDTLLALSKQEQRPAQSVLDDAVERYRREAFLDRANEAYAELRADPHAWEIERREREAWDNTLADGLDES